MSEFPWTRSGSQAGDHSDARTENSAYPHTDCKAWPGSCGYVGCDNWAPTDNAGNGEAIRQWRREQLSRVDAVLAKTDHSPDGNTSPKFERSEHSDVSNDALFQEMTAEEYGLWVSKGTEYRNGGDRLANFTEVAAENGLEPLQVWAVYAAKHWRAIMNYVRTGAEGVEGIESRLTDLGVYAKLGRLLVRMGKKAPTDDVQS